MAALLKDSTKEGTSKDSQKEDGEGQASADDEAPKSIDWFEQFSLQTVEQGEVLAVEVPPVMGSSGINVLGEELPVEEGNRADLTAYAGPGTEVIDDRIVAAIPGEPNIAESKLAVCELTAFPKNIDFATGNVRFPGSVHVKGNVNPGFTVSAKDNVEIGGGVQGATVTAAGSVLIGGGFLGEADGRSGTLMAGGELKVKFVESGTVAVGGDMLVGGDIVRGDVSVLGKLKVEGGGRIIGGRISAGKEVHAKTIGSPTGARTVVSVGNPSAEEKTVKKLVAARALATMTEEDAKNPDEPDEEPDPDAAVEAAEDETSVEEDKPERKPRIMVSDAIYPGAVIGIGHAVKIVDTRIDHCILREVNNDIRIFPL